MAVTFTSLNQHSNAVFLTDLLRVDISAPRVKTLYFQIMHGADIIFSEKYAPYDDGTVSIFGLDKVIGWMLGPVADGPLNFTFWACDDSNRADGQICSLFVIPCNVDMPTSADEFCENNFLTVAPSQRRDTAIGRKQTLTAYLPAYGAACTATATYVSIEKGAVHEEIAMPYVQKGVTEIDVSPAQFVDDDKGLLVAYEVRVGKRLARFSVLPHAPEADPAIVFLNCFGAYERLYFTGTRTQTPSIDRSSITIEGRAVVYDVQSKPTWTAYSGPLRPALVPLYNDLLEAREAWLMDSDGNPADPIAITGEDAKATNEDTVMPNIQITFERARYRRKMEMPTKEQIFSAQFSPEYE